MNMHSIQARHIPAVAIGTLLALFGITVLLARQISPGLLTPLPGIEALSSVTALNLSLSGGALLALLLPERIGIARVHLIIGALLCLLTLASLSNLFSPHGPFVVDGFPSHNSSVAFFLSGLLLIVSHRASTVYTVSALFLLFILICAIALLGIIELTLGFDPIFGWSVHMSVYTIGGLLLFACALAHTTWQRVRYLPLDPVRGISAVTGILVTFIAFAGGIVSYTIAGAHIYQLARHELHQLAHERAERLFTAKETTKLRLQLLAERLAVSTRPDAVRQLALATEPNAYGEVIDTSTGKRTRFGPVTPETKEQVSVTSPGFTLLRYGGHEYTLRHEIQQGEQRVIAELPLHLAAIIDDDFSTMIDYDLTLCTQKDARTSSDCLAGFSRMHESEALFHEYWHPLEERETDNDHRGLFLIYNNDDLLQTIVLIPELKLMLRIQRDISNIFGPLYHKMLYAMPLMLLLFVSGVGFVTWRITPLVRTIQKSERRFRLLAENANDMISLHDMEGNYLYASPACQRLLGYTEDELIGHNANEFIHPDDLTVSRESHDTVVSTDEIPRITFRIRRKDGSFAWFETASSRVPPGTYSEAEIITISRDITLKHRVQEKLRESEYRYRTLVEQASDAIILHDTERRFIEVNQAACRLLGYSREELIGMHPEDFLLQEEHEDTRRRREVLRHHTIASRRRLRRKDGTLAIVDIHATGIEGGGIISIVRDVSEELRIENALHDSMERWRSLVETAPDTIMTVNRHAELLFINRVPSILNRIEVIGSSVLDFVTPQHRETIMGAIARVYAGEEHVECEIEANGDNGKTVWWSSRCGPVYRDGNIESVIIVSRDISERHRMELALRSSERRNRSVVEVLAEGIVVQDKNGTIVFSNMAAHRILGRTDDDVYGLTTNDPIWAVIREDGNPFPEDLLPATVALATGKSQREVVIGLMRPDGERVWISVNAEPIWDDEHREVVSVVSSFSDITEQRQAENQLRKSRERLRALTAHLQEVREEEKATIAREVHDELGSSMTALKLGISWLQTRLGDTKPVIREKLDGMSILLDHAVATVRRLVTRLRPTMLDDLGLWAALEWELREFARYSQVHVSHNLNAQEVEVNRDKALAIYRVLQEALTNIAKHANANKVRLDCWDRAGILHIALEDNGVGISETTTLNPTSHGLRGMYERIGSLGGKLEILGSPDEGTVITIKIPHD